MALDTQEHLKSIQAAFKTWELQKSCYYNEEIFDTEYHLEDLANDRTIQHAYAMIKTAERLKDILILEEYQTVEFRDLT